MPSNVLELYHHSPGIVVRPLKAYVHCRCLDEAHVASGKERYARALVVFRYDLPPPPPPRAAVGVCQTGPSHAPQRMTSDQYICPAQSPLESSGDPTRRVK